MKPKVYIETTIISYLASRPGRDLITAAHQQITHDWWETRLTDFEVYISQFVLDEAGAGDADAAVRRLALLDAFPLLDATAMTKSASSQPSIWNRATSRWRSTRRGRWQAMKKTTIKAVEMVRRIRDAHYEQLRGKSPEERIAFYRAKSCELQAKIATSRAEQPVNEQQSA